MHFGPYTLHHLQMGSDLVGRFVASRPEDDGSQLGLLLDLPTPSARQDPQFVRCFEASTATTLALSHPNILLPLEHGVDAGVPYLAHAYVRGVSLVELQRRLEQADQAWPASVVTYVIEHVHQALLHIAQLHEGTCIELEPTHVWFDGSGNVYIDAFRLVGGWDPRPGHRLDVRVALSRLRRSVVGSDTGSPETAALADRDRSSSREQIQRWVQDELAGRTDPLRASASENTDRDGVPVRRRFRRTQHAFAPTAPSSVGTVVQVTNERQDEMTGDMGAPVPRGLTLEMDAPVEPFVPPPPSYNVSPEPDDPSGDLPLSRLTVEAPVAEGSSLPPAHSRKTPDTPASNSVQDRESTTVVTASESRLRASTISLGWKITWIVGCVTAGVLIGLLATAMLGFGPLAASNSDPPSPGTSRTDEP